MHPHRRLHCWIYRVKCAVNFVCRSPNRSKALFHIKALQTSLPVFFSFIQHEMANVLQENFLVPFRVLDAAVRWAALAVHSPGPYKFHTIRSYKRIMREQVRGTLERVLIRSICLNVVLSSAHRDIRFTAGQAGYSSNINVSSSGHIVTKRIRLQRWELRTNGWASPDRTSIICRAPHSMMTNDSELLLLGSDSVPNAFWVASY